MHTKKSDLFKILLIAAILAILISNSKTITSSSRARFADFASIPLKAAQSTLSGVRRMMPFASLRQENKLLRDRANLLARRLEEAKVTAAENERLKGLLNFKKEIPYATTAARVIGRDPANWSSSVIIDKGVSGGIKQNKAVLSTKGLVGRVVEAGRHSARILLITDPNSKVGVVILRNREGGMLVGRSDNRCKLVYLALDSDVKKGDKVMTAGFGTIFPRNILVGEVIKVDKEPGRLYKYAIVEPAEEMSGLEEVLCIK